MSHVLTVAVILTTNWNTVKCRELKVKWFNVGLYLRTIKKKTLSFKHFKTSKVCNVVVNGT